MQVTRLALVGHSMGGLIVRAAGAVATEVARPWTDLAVSTWSPSAPPPGAPIAAGIVHGSRGLARLPETAALGRILDLRSVGVHDLVAGLAHDVPPLPRARYRLVAATVTTGARHPVGHVVGDLLVRVRSAYGEGLFPDATLLHVGRTDHFGLLNHPDVHRTAGLAVRDGSARLTGMTGSADRELRAEADVAAPPERVWALLTNFSRMFEWSPELVRMVPLKGGGPVAGTVVPRHQPPQGRRGRPGRWWPSSTPVGPWPGTPAPAAPGGCGS